MWQIRTWLRFSPQPRLLHLYSLRPPRHDVLCRCLDVLANPIASAVPRVVQNASILANAACVSVAAWLRQRDRSAQLLQIHVARAARLHELLVCSVASSATTTDAKDINATTAKRQTSSSCLLSLLRICDRTSWAGRPWPPVSNPAQRRRRTIPWFLSQTTSTASVPQWRCPGRDRPPRLSLYSFVHVFTSN